MSEQTTQTAGGENQAGTGQTATEASKAFSQDDVNSLLADQKRKLRDQFAGFDDMKKQLETLQAEKRQREEAEMSELDKLKAEIAERDAKLQELEPFKLREETRMAALREKVESEAESLSDAQKAILEAISDPDKQLAYIGQVKEAAAAPVAPFGGKGGGKDGSVTAEEVTGIREKYGPASPQFKEAQAKYRAGQGYR